jgi:hypothetical protein
MPFSKKTIKVGLMWRVETNKRTYILTIGQETGWAADKVLEEKLIADLSVTCRQDGL